MVDESAVHAHSLCTCTAVPLVYCMGSCQVDAPACFSDTKLQQHEREIAKGERQVFTLLNADTLNTPCTARRSQISDGSTRDRQG